MLKRKIYSKMLKWKEDREKQALLITGARQTGKSYIAREFGKTEFSSYVEINMLQDSDALRLFNSNPSIENIIAYISTFTSGNEMDKSMLVFLDEIQECKDPLTIIKFLVEKAPFRIVLSGSLLGVSLKGIRSIPVGYLDILEMHPMDFEEFCYANGVSERAIKVLSDCFMNKEPVDDSMHNRIMGLFRFYLVVGGMPEAVDAFISSHDIVKVRAVQHSIEEAYKLDISKYCTSERVNLSNIYELIPSELNNQNKRFKLASLGKGTRFGKNENSFLWLCEAGVSIAAYVAHEPKVPLLLSKSSNLMKLFLSDVGMLTSMYPIEITQSILSGDDAVNWGGIYENAVAQELTAHGQRDLFYYHTNKLGEVDFLAEIDGEAIPIEVKSGKGYYRHSALDNIMKVDNYNLKKAYILTPANLKTDGNKYYIPVYMAMFLASETKDSMIRIPDITGLN